MGTYEGSPRHGEALVADHQPLFPLARLSICERHSQDERLKDIRKPSSFAVSGMKDQVSALVAVAGWIGFLGSLQNPAGRARGSTVSE